MNEFSEVMANELAQRSIALVVTAGIVFALLRIVKPTSARAHRCAWCLVLLQGWMIFQYAIPIPWLRVTGGIELVKNDTDIPKKETTPTQISPRIPQPVNTPENNPTDSIPKNDLEKTNVERQPSITKTSATEPANPPISIPSQDTYEAAIPMNWQSWLIVFWLTGIAIFVLRWVFSYIRFVKSLTKFRDTNLREGEAPAEPKLSLHTQWQTEWQELLRERNISQKINLTIHNKIGPILCRLPGSYKIVVPRKLWETLSAVERRSILEHELAHLQRGDVWKSLAMRILSLPHWFNPCSWLTVRAFDEAAEWACDDIVRKRNPEAHVTFAKTLMQLVEFDSPSQTLRPAAFGSSISYRVKRLLSHQQLKDSKMKKTLIGLFTLAVIVLCLVRPQLTAGDLEKNPSTNNLEEKVAQKKEEQKKETRPKVSREKLRFDGKNFAVWKEILRTDLSPSQQKKAIRAFGAFGRNGYHKEAAQAIAEVAYYYDFSRYYSMGGEWFINSPNSVGMVAFSEFKRIDHIVIAEVLRNSLNSSNNQNKWFAILYLYHRDYSYPDEYRIGFVSKPDVNQRVLELVPLVLDIAKSSQGKLRAAAIYLILRSKSNSKDFDKLLLEWMKSKDDHTSLAACSALLRNAPKTAGLAERFMSILMKNPSQRLRRRMVLRALGILRESSKNVLPILMDLIRHDAKNHLRSLNGQLMPNFPSSFVGSGYDVGDLMKTIGSNGVAPLLKMYKDGNEVEKFYVLRIFRQMGAKAKEARLFLEKEAKEIRNEKGKVMSQLDKLILTTLSRIK